MPASVNPSRRRLPGGIQGPLYSGGFYGSTKQLRKDGAEERNKYRDQLSAEQQIARLDRRLGAGVGAKRERAALAKEIALKKGK